MVCRERKIGRLGREKGEERGTVEEEKCWGGGGSSKKTVEGGVR